MPELPETELLCERIRQSHVKKKLEQIELVLAKEADPALREGLERLAGTNLTDVARYGAYLLQEFEGKTIIALNLMGDVVVEWIKSQPSTEEVPKNYLMLRYQGGQSLRISGTTLPSKIALMDENSSVDHLLRLGPDALVEEGIEEHLKESLARRRTAIRNILLDETFIAGIGPLWSDEILFQTRLRPDRSAKNLSEQEVERLLRQIPRVLKRAVRCQAKANLLPKNFLTRHRAEDGVCPACQGALLSTKVGGRQSCYCPQCQPDPSEDIIEPVVEEAVATGEEASAAADSDVETTVAEPAAES